MNTDPSYWFSLRMKHDLPYFVRFGGKNILFIRQSVSYSFKKQPPAVSSLRQSKLFQLQLKDTFIQVLPDD